jgi:hypothetical protein
MASIRDMDASCKGVWGCDMLWRPIVMILIGATLAISCEGQRAGGGIHGGGMPGGGHGPGFGVAGGFPNIPFRGNFRFRHFGNFGGYGAFWTPWAYPWDCWYWSLDANGNWCGDSPQTSESYAGSAQKDFVAPIIIDRSAPAAPAPPPEPPKLIEVPPPKEAPVAKPLPATLFILKDGGRLESRRYLLTDQSLKIEDGREQHTIPVSALDLDATIAANHERGIEVTIPRDRNTVFLGF